MRAFTRTVSLAAFAIGGTITPLPMAAQTNISSEAVIPAPPAPRQELSDLGQVFAPGVVEPISGERDISAAVEGQIAQVLVDEGQHVKAGQVLVEIQNEDRKAELAAAQAQLAMREAELQRLIAGPRPEERAEAEAQLHEADASLQLARNVLDRRMTLVRTGALSKEAGDRARTDFDTALARREVASERLALMTLPARSEDVAIAQAKVAGADAQVQDAQARLEMTLLRSPIDGVVLKRYRLAGEAVSDLPPTLVATVGDITRLRVRAEVDESDVEKIAVGERATISADAFGEERFEGKVTKISSRLGPKNLKRERPGERVDTKTLDAIIDLSGTPPLPVGLRVDVKFDPSTIADAVRNRVPTNVTPNAKPPFGQSTEVRSPSPTVDSSTGAPSIATSRASAPWLSSNSPSPSPARTVATTSQTYVPALVAPSATPIAYPVPAAYPVPVAPEASGLKLQPRYQEPAPKPATSSQPSLGGAAKAASGPYTLQFASCSTETCALTMVTALRDHGAAAGIVHSRDSSGRQWFTVRAGAFSDAATAAVAAKAYGTTAGVPSAIVVRGRGPA